jgi:glycosyltransferase involved in cell wall biosynthesis
MGKLCMIGVDENKVLKDFVRAHVEYLAGEKVCVTHAYPDYTCGGRTIRVYHGTRPLQRKLCSLLPQFLYRPWVGAHERSEARMHDALTDFFRHHEVDVILAEFGPNGAGVWRHAQRLGIPLIVHFHGHDAHRSQTVDPLREEYRAMFQAAFRIVSVSRFMTDALVALGCDPAKVVTNPYGPRDSFFEITPDYRPTLLALGRFTDIKANYLTLMAFRQLAERVPQARLVMAGEGELLEACRTLAEVWGLAGRVDFPGAVPHADNRALFSQACAFVQHSVIPSYGDAEGTPVVILEAQAAGLPVIATRHAGIADAVIDGHTGFLVAERDVDAMAERMLDLLSHPDICRTLGANAREHIRSHYSMARHIGCLQEIVDSARAAAKNVIS